MTALSDALAGVAIDPSVQTPEGFTEHGVDTIAPLFARGVLLDCADAGHAVGAEHLERAAEGLEIGPGDAILVRTGTGALWEDREAFLAAGGIDAGGSRWCAERKPLAVGADNVAWDVPGAVDPELGSLPGHLLLLVRAGIYILEALNLEALARDGVREFAFACLPLKLRAGPARRCARSRWCRPPAWPTPTTSPTTGCTSPGTPATSRSSPSPTPTPWSSTHGT